MLELAAFKVAEVTAFDPSGSDEAATGACPDTLYTCANLPHKSTQVFASRVNDGLCDCCDGSDEWQRPALCPNTCVSSTSN